MKAPWARGRRSRARDGGPIRVAYVTPTLQPGGAERQMLILARALPKDRFDVRFIVMADSGAWADDATALGIPVHHLGLSRTSRAFDPRSAIRAARALRAYIALTRGVDVVDAWLVPAFTFAGLARPIAKVPVLIAGRRSLLDVYAGKPWYRRAAASLATRFADAVVTNSKVGKAELIDREGVAASRVFHIPNAVVPIAPDVASRAAVRARWGVSDDDIVVGCIANYKAGKGLESLIDAAAQLGPTGPSLRFVLVGDGPLRDQLERRIADRSLSGTVILHGFDEDARALLPAFDIAVQASRSEGLPNAVLEAAAAALPIVATAVGGTAEILESSEMGLLVEPDDVAGLAAAIARLAADPVLRQEMGDAARRRSCDFSPDRLADSTAELYIQLLGRRPDRQPRPARSDA